MTEELSTQKGSIRLEIITKNHNFPCKRGIQARSNSLSRYFSGELGVTQMASTVFKERGELWLTLQTQLA